MVALRSLSLLLFSISLRPSWCKRAIIHQHAAAPKCAAPTPPAVPDNMSSPWSAKSPCMAGLFGDTEDGAMRSYNIIIDAKNLAFLDNKVTAEEWAQCDLEVNYGRADASTVKGVRCRYKGSVGSFVGCADATGKKLPSTGNKGCRKLSWKISLKKGKNKEAAMGLKMFQLLGMQHDDSLLRNRLSYAILNDAGFVAPCGAPANVYVNGVYTGLSDMIENVDSVFTKKRFASDANSGKGTLYKETWPVSGDPEFYKDMKPIPGLAGPGIKEKGDGKDHSRLFADLRVRAEECLEEKIEPCDAGKASVILDTYTDAQSFIDGLVGMTMVANWDQIINLFHNFYIYIKDDAPNGPKLFYVPWDFNEVLVSTHGAPFSSVDNPTGISLPFPWFHELTAEERKVACPWTPDIAALKHFTCDPVAQLMAKAWKQRFFETFKRVSENATEKAQAHFDRWGLQTSSAIACDAQNGNWPPTEKQTAAAAPLLPKFRAILDLWNGLGDGTAEWPVVCSGSTCREKSDGARGSDGGVWWAMVVAFGAVFAEARS